MTHHVILRTITLILLPFMFMFGLYVLLHGKISPGGGFQGGAISATVYSLYALIFSSRKAQEIISARALKAIACVGCLVYCGTGFLTIYQGGKFLDYAMLADDAHKGQFIGIMVIESGVWLTVFAVLSLIFLRLNYYSDRS